MRKDGALHRAADHQVNERGRFMIIRHSPRGARRLRRALSMILLAAGGGLVAVHAAETQEAFIPKLVNSSTVPSNGDLNPYGVAFVPEGFPAGGAISSGDVLVANFNSSANIQGTGTTIIQLTPSGALAPPGSATTFFDSALPGLSTALGVLKAGFVLVGNVPTTDGTAATIGQGALQIIDRHGKAVQTLTDAALLDGPWDLAVDDHGTWAQVFVSSVLNGVVSRFDVAATAKGLTILKKTQVAGGYTHVPNAAAVVLGPTGLAFDKESDTLYVASTADNAIYAVSGASRLSGAGGRGKLVFADAHLRGPLALRFAPNGHLLAANGDAVNGDPLHPSEIVEFTRSGHFVREYDVDPSQGGAFGIDTVLHGGAYNYAVVDDVTNSLSVYGLPAEE
jgi:DNA-binding beta-propeller fold protein YncE